VPSFTVPAWQKGPGVSNKYSNGARQVPDVAAAAINISFYYSGLWLGVGGTSAAAPIWASGVDVVNQDLAAAHKPLVGGVPNLYSLANGSARAKVYYDVTKGDNLFYPATDGWDFTTGWGAPQFDQIATALGGA
jgi:kumamolisin